MAPQDEEADPGSKPGPAPVAERRSLHALQAGSILEGAVGATTPSGPPMYDETPPVDRVVPILRFASDNSHGGVRGDRSKLPPIAQESGEYIAAELQADRDGAKGRGLGK